MATDPRPTDAAIVGMGAVFPGAGSLAAYRHNLFAGVDAITDVPPGRWDPQVYYAPDGPSGSDRFYCRRGGFVDDLAAFDPTRFGIMPSVVAGAEPDQLLALHATAEAIADAGGEDRLPADRARIGVVLGRGGFMGVATARLDQRVRTAHQLSTTLHELAPELSSGRIAAIRRAFQEALGPEQPEASIGLVPSFTAARTANRLDFRGPAYTLDAACASSLLAVDQAVGLLAADRCDLVVAGAVHHCHIATLWSVFTQLGALSPSERIRPFDRRADGTLLSEGTGVVLLKRLADAQRDGDRVYAVIRGVGVAGDGRAASLMSPLVDGQVQALERAWASAGLDPAAAGSIGLLEAHGTGTPIGDEAELSTLARVFGPPGASGPIALGSVKSMLGHTMQASGMAGLIKAALAVHEGVLPPTLHLDDPHEGLARTRMRPVRTAEPWEPGPGPRRAAVNAFGFGGINAHAILEEAPRARAAQPPVRRFLPLGSARGAARPRPSAGPASVLLLTADAPEAMARLLAAPEPTADDHGGPCRLAIAEPDAERLALAGKVVARGRPWRGRGGVWFTPRPLLGPYAQGSGGKLALLFPGLEPDFAPVLDDVAARLGLEAPALTGGGELVERALDALATGRFFHRVLAELDLHPDLLAGHSLGEWAAMVAAGMYPQEAVDTFLGSLRPGSLAVPDLVYAALGCGAPQAAAALHGLEGVALSHDNCPHQSVVCGPPRQIAAVLARLADEGVLGQELPFRSGFHTPMWQPYLGQVRAAFERLPLQAAGLPVWSATTTAPYPREPEGVRELVVRHLLEPVDFRGLTLQLHAEGVRAFVSAGPGSLTGFVEDTLRGSGHLAVAASSPRLSGLDALRHLAAALWTEGLQPRWDRLTAAAPPTAHSASPTAPTASTAPERTGRPVRLDLGSPLVHLDAAVTPLWERGRRPAPRHPAATNARPELLSALDAVLDASEAAAHAVTEALAAGPAGRAVTRPDARPPAPAPSGPRTHTRRLSLDTLPSVRDHCVYLQPEDWPQDADRFPVVPMTTMLELAAEAALADRPGQCVTGFDDMRALRWLPVAPAVDIAFTTRPAGDGRVRVDIGDCASVTVRLGSGHDAPPAPGRAPLTSEGPAPVSAEALYRDRWMFHGPRFAGVHEVTAVADDGIRGVLRALPAPGALLDAAGQLLGHWMQLRLDCDRLVFPAVLERVRLYGPPPAPGTLLAATARIHEVRATSVRGDVELRTPDGAVWARLEDWTYRRFGADERVWPMKFTPEVSGIGEPQPGGWCVATRRWSDPASQELVMRRYLGAAEREVYERLAPRARAPWLLGRIAAKDALRQLLWDRGAGPVFPAEVTVGHDEAGRPVPGGLAAGLHVTLAHKARIAVASARGDGPVGIDVEPVAEDPGALIRIALTQDEHRLAVRLAGRDGTGFAAAVTALWCAKEAAAKAEGTGLGGRLVHWQVSEDPAGGLRVLSPAGRTHRVRTAAYEGHQVAWTVPSDPADPDGARAAPAAESPETPLTPEKARPAHSARSAPATGAALPRPSAPDTFATPRENSHGF
ncbi:Phthiocerol synthesis polyketide synthase type I PpsD [Streptomyces xanthophaeus]|uniref:type I polyketide synthase n=1 Tax=Streptomyces xanthophaeus TaxID=67385 RepID=UPI00233F04E8|nr:type I polyketide synthase [Streptomyces xanthophaeus]WCD90688.1 Phthiocerol synthesis polyketide synthase type I PpsD [Streptomyces xanthophaeus]